MIKKIFKSSRAFTLVEMLVAVGLFIVIVFISLGAILNIFDANRRNQSSKTVVDNLNFSVENLARTVRFGANYHCGTSGDLENPSNCSNGDGVLAVEFDGDTIVYRLCGTVIKRSDQGEDNCNDNSMKAITSPETVVQYLQFYVFGATDNPSLQQPYVVAVIKGYVGNKPTIQSAFSIETVMSQRKLDI